MNLQNSLVTHGIVARAGTRVRASSDGLGWKSLAASLQQEQPFAGTFSAVADHLLVFHLGGPARVRGFVRDHTTAQLVPPGHVFLWPGGESVSIELEDALDTIHIYLRRQLIDEMVEDLGVSAVGTLQLTPRLGEPDPLLESLAVEVRRCLERPDLNTPLYVEQIARMMAAHLVHNHSNLTTPIALPVHRGLGKRQIDRIDDFIDTNLVGRINLSDLAKAAALSETWFVRRFRTATGLPPHQYVLRRRIRHAKRLLMQTELSIAAVAFDCGFSHQEHLTRTFRKFTGTTPAAYRKNN